MVRFFDWDLAVQRAQTKPRAGRFEVRDCVFTTSEKVLVEPGQSRAPRITAMHRATGNHRNVGQGVKTVGVRFLARSDPTCPM